MIFDSQSENSQPLSEEIEAEGPEILGSHCCDLCMGDNLLKETGIRSCARCRNPYCIHFASKADPFTFCVGCFSDLELIRSTYIKTTETYNEQTDTTRVYTQRARRIELKGEDWLFTQRRIKDLSDPEAELATEVHRQMLNLLLADQERRKAEKMHRNAGVKIIMNPGTATTTQTTVTTVKQTTGVKLDKTKEKVNAIMSQLLAKGLTMDMIQQLLQKP